MDIKQRDALAEQLFEILVFADNANGKVRVRGPQLRHQCRDDIVSFKPLRADDRYADLLQRRKTARHLRLKIFRWRGALGFVVRVQLRAERAAVAADIQRDGDVVRLATDVTLAAEQLEQHAQEPERHVGRFLGDRRRHRRADGVVGPEELCVAVDDEERGHQGWSRKALSATSIARANAAALFTVSMYSSSALESATIPPEACK